MSLEYADDTVILVGGKVVLLANFGADRRAVHVSRVFGAENETAILTVQITVVD